METDNMPDGAAVEVAAAVIETEVAGAIVDEIIEIEVFVKNGQQPPLAKGYVIRVDKERIVVHHHEITGRQILELAHKTPPDSYILREIFSGGRSEIVGLNQIVDLHRHKVEKFKTLPRDQTEG